MQELKGHIINELNWKTSIDNKEEAYRLQERISRWTNQAFLRMTARLFDRFCPPDQVWKINALELDLGPIAYPELEEKLEEKIQAALEKKLTELLLYKKLGPDESMEVMGEMDSALGVMEEFLMSGLFHQWGSGEKYTPEKLMLEQLQENNAALIRLVRRIGKSGEKVARRISWQFSEPVIIKLVEGLEPGHHVEIVSFTREIKKVQERKLVLKAGSGEFRKNVWFSVLSYLLMERGSVFNRIAFLRSSIRRMADHYNVDYADLLRLIAEAAESVSSDSTSRPEFLAVIAILSDELKKNAKSELESIPGETPEEMLEHIFDSGVNAVKQKRKLIADLLRFMSEEGTGKAAKILRELYRSGKLDQRSLALLDADTTSLMLQSLAGGNGDVLMEGIRFLELATSELEVRLPKHFFIRTAVSQLLKNAHATSHGIFSELVKGTATLARVQLHELFFLLRHIIIPEPYRNISVATLLEKAGAEEQLPHSDLPNEKMKTDRIRNLLVRINRERDISSWKTETADVWVKWIVENPIAAFRLIEGKRKAEAVAIINSLLSPAEVQRFVERSGSVLALEIMGLARQLEIMSLPKAPAALVRKLQLFLKQAAIAVVFQPNKFNERQWIEELMLRFIAEESGTDRLEALYLLDELTSSTGVRTHTSLKAYVEQLRSKENSKAYLEKKISLMLGKPESVAAERMDKIASLRAGFHHTFFVHFRRENSSAAQRMMQVLLPGSEEIFHDLVPVIKKWLRLSNKSVPVNFIAEQVEELFWLSLLDVAAGKRSKEELVKAIVRAVLFRFPDTAKENKQPVFLWKYFSVEERTRLFPVSKIITGEKQEEEISGRKKSATHKQNLLQLPGSSGTIEAKELFRVLAQAIRAKEKQVVLNKAEMDFSALFLLALHMQPAGLRTMLKEIKPGANELRFISSHITIEEFLSWMQSLFGAGGSEMSEVIRFLSAITARLAPSLAVRLSESYWEKAMELVCHAQPSAAMITALVTECMAMLTREGRLGTEIIFTEMRRRQLKMSPMLEKTIRDIYPAFKPGKEERSFTAVENLLQELAEKQVLADCIEHLAMNGEVPSWAGTLSAAENDEALTKSVLVYPAEFYRALQSKQFTAEQFRLLAEKLKFGDLAAGIAALHPSMEDYLDQLTTAFHVMAKVDVQGISAGKLQQVFRERVLNAWLTGNLKLIAAGKIWQELFWELCTRRGLRAEWIVTGLAKQKLLFPAALLIALENTIAQIKEPGVNPVKRKVPEKKSPEKPAAPMRTIPVKNAGLVLLNSYLAMLFDRIGLTENKQFKGKAEQEQAIHYSQFVVTGLSRTDESLLVLNKVLCGWPIDEPVSDGIEISEGNRKLIDGLIKAAIGYWEAIGSTSVEGFRGNWLVRDGLLVQHEDKWELTVEKRAYDLLISKSPYTFSIIRMPWMEFPLHVNWNY